MLIKLAMTRGDDKTYTTEFNPPQDQSDPVLDGIFPDTEWLSELPFETDSLTFFISDRPLNEGPCRNYIAADPVRQIHQEQDALRDAERPRTQAAQLKGEPRYTTISLQRRARPRDHR